MAEHPRHERGERVPCRDELTGLVEGHPRDCEGGCNGTALLPGNPDAPMAFEVWEDTGMLGDEGRWFWRRVTKLRDRRWEGPCATEAEAKAAARKALGGE